MEVPRVATPRSGVTEVLSLGRISLVGIGTGRGHRRSRAGELYQYVSAGGVHRMANVGCEKQRVARCLEGELREVLGNGCVKRFRDSNEKRLNIYLGMHVCVMT